MNNNYNLSCIYNKDTKGPSVTIKIEGELNGTTVEFFEQEVKHIFLKQPQDIFLDLTEVTIIVSSAIGSLLLLQDYVTQKKYKFEISAVNDKVRNILVMMGLDYLMVL